MTNGGIECGSCNSSANALCVENVRSDIICVSLASFECIFCISIIFILTYLHTNHY